MRRPLKPAHFVLARISYSVPDGFADTDSTVNRICPFKPSLVV